MNDDAENINGPKAVSLNLQDFRELAPEKQKNIASSGGKASGEARRLKNTFRDIASSLLELNAPKKVAKKIKKIFPDISVEGIDNRTALICSQLARALNGDTRAFEVIRDTAGEKPANVNEHTITGVQIVVADKNIADLVDKI